MLLLAENEARRSAALADGAGQQFGTSLNLRGRDLKDIQGGH